MTHARFWQICPPPQAMHAPPVVGMLPHAVVVVPAWQTPAKSQHPPEHVCELQGPVAPPPVTVPPAVPPPVTKPPPVVPPEVVPPEVVKPPPEVPAPLLKPPVQVPRSQVWPSRHDEHELPFFPHAFELRPL